MSSAKRRVGIVGYGNLGKFLVQALRDRSEKYEIAFIWNRSKDKLADLAAHETIENLDEFESRSADLIVEVAHPNILKTYGERFLASADLLVGSPTAFADSEVADRLFALANRPESSFGLYIAAGALWGGQDIKKMNDLGLLRGLAVTMKKHPDSLKLVGELGERLDNFKRNDERYLHGGEYVVYEGSVSELCPLAPNNVNTMAVAALAATPSLSFHQVKARLVADSNLEAHVIVIEVFGRSIVLSSFSDLSLTLSLTLPF